MVREVSLEELNFLCDKARDAIWKKAAGFGREPKLYLHWTAGRYDQCFDDYHVNITGDGKVYVSTDDLADVLEHTWRRNTGSIGITLCAAYGAQSDSLGSYGPTKVQVEVMAKVVQVLADALWLTIDKVHVLTHGEAADNEDGVEVHPCYGPKSTCERWDLEFLGTEESPRFDPGDELHRGGSVLRGKANWYRERNRERDQGKS